MRQLLRWFSLCPTQLPPNGWWLALGFFGLWGSLFPEERPSAWREFAWCYKLQTTKNGMPYFQALDGRALFKPLPSNSKAWHQKFFFVFDEWWEYPSDEEDPIRVQRTWRVLSA